MTLRPSLAFTALLALIAPFALGAPLALGAPFALGINVAAAAENHGDDGDRNDDGDDDGGDDRLRPADLQPFKFAPHASLFELENGLKVVIVPDRRAPLVIHMIQYRAGGADDPPGKTGLAHFLEHMMFKGTEKNPGSGFKDALLGYGADFNAFTGHDVVAYHEKVAVERLDDVMRLEADRMNGLTIDDNDLETERKVVLEERSLRIDNQPGGAFHERMAEASWHLHPYGRSLVGLRRDVLSIDKDDMLTFYRRRYAPNNAVLVIVGDIESEEALRLAERRYGQTPARPIDITPEPEADPPGRRVRRRFEMIDPRVRSPRLRRHYRAPDYDEASPEAIAALSLIVSILGDDRVGRLQRNLVDRDRIAVAAGAWHRSMARFGGEVVIYATPAPGVDPEIVEKAIDREIAALLERGPTPEDLRQTKNSHLGQFILALDNPEALSRFYGQAVMIGLDPEDIADMPFRLNAVTASQALEAARKTLRIDNSATGWLLPPPAAADSPKPPINADETDS